jgi:APA family basic amino acid/polyamine antiporter
MIGSGIFIVSADITRHIGSAGWLIAVWIIGGFMTLAAALSYGELSGMYPKAGGQYTYLKEAYNPLVAFVYGWSLFAVIQTGTIAAVGVSFSKFLAYLIPSVSEDLVLFQVGSFKISPAQTLAIVLIFFLTYINTRGLKGGKIIQTTFTITKILSIFALIVFGFIYGSKAILNANWHNAWHIQQLTANGAVTNYQNFPSLMGALAAAMVGSVMAYEAWNNVTFIAGEITNPKRNIGLSLLLGTVIVTLLYVLLNLMFTNVLTIQEIISANKDRVGLVASNAIFGKSGTLIISLMILVATFGCNNGLIISGARVYYSMARDGLFFKQASTLNKKAIPEIALWLQAIMASILCLSGKYGDLLDMITFIAVIFYVFTIAGIFILRQKQPDIERPYRAFGYPIIPIIYIILGLAFCSLLIIYKPMFTWPGLGIAALGVPLFFLTKRGNKEN